MGASPAFSGEIIIFILSTKCTSETFKIHRGKNNKDNFIRGEDEVGIRSHNGNWLSMYSPSYCKCTKSTGFCNCGHTFWTTRACPGDGSNWLGLNRCEMEVHFIKNVIRDDTSILENGDFVNIK